MAISHGCRVRVFLPRQASASGVLRRPGYTPLPMTTAPGATVRGATAPETLPLTFRSHSTVEGQRDKERSCRLSLAYRRLPFGQFGWAECCMDALVGCMRPCSCIRRQLREHGHVSKSRLAKTPVETGVSTAFGARRAVREGLDLQLQLSP